VRGDEHGINVLTFQELPVIVKEIRVLQLGGGFRPIPALVVNVASGGHHDVILVGVLVDALQVVLADAEPHPHHRHGNLVIGARDIGGRRLGLAINRVLSSGAAEAAAAASADFFRNSRRGNAADFGDVLFPYQIVILVVVYTTINRRRIRKEIRRQSCKRMRRPPVFWTAAGSKAPRRFRTQ